MANRTTRKSKWPTFDGKAENITNCITIVFFLPSTEYAIQKLRQEGNEEGTYVLRWSCTDYQYIIITVVCTEIDLKESRTVRQYKNFQIEVAPTGFRLYGTETVRATLFELLEHLEGQSLRTDNLQFQLHRCCPPQPRGKLNQAMDIQKIHSELIKGMCTNQYPDEEKHTVLQLH
ncbi:tyrosine-protein kinase JAK1-like [Notothenia coriiceps]|uniref:Tyrosine-protein kinase JAK1-like n=1 Tax=Notothenia coriiceps TaxID=8208 RepID=A0A6I9MSX3_9TELE|nr:PREDICTED: tyrosine-protein kinase JAK1-like [Notothenia coriiceps]